MKKLASLLTINGLVPTYAKRRIPNSNFEKHYLIGNRISDSLF